MLFRCCSGCCKPSKKNKVSSTNTEQKQGLLMDDDSEYFDCVEGKDELEADLNYMMTRLSPEDIEVAARTDYHYLQGQNPNQTHHCATAMARRYLESKQHPDKALGFMKSTLKFRREIEVDKLRQIFNPEVVRKNQDQEYRKTLEQFLSSKKNYVMCYDRDGRATHIFVPRNTKKHDHEWTIKESVYTIERAIACSKAPGSSVNAIIDFNGFIWEEHAPPFTLGKEFLMTLRNHYVGQIHKIFILDAPLGFSILWNIFQGFVGTNTRNKIVFLSGDDKMKLENFYSKEQAAGWMIEGGKKKKELDIKNYLYDTPFDQAFDEE